MVIPALLNQDTETAAGPFEAASQRVTRLGRALASERLPSATAPLRSRSGAYLNVRCCLGCGVALLEAWEEWGDHPGGITFFLTAKFRRGYPDVSRGPCKREQSQIVTFPQ